MNVEQVFERADAVVQFTSENEITSGNRHILCKKAEAQGREVTPDPVCEIKHPFKLIGQLPWWNNITVVIDRENLGKREVGTLLCKRAHQFCDPLRMIEVVRVHEADNAAGRLSDATIDAGMSTGVTFVSQQFH